MAESVANLFDLLKEVWTQDRLEKQFYSESRFLDRIEKTSKYTIGRRAQVPIESSLPGGYTVHTAAGGSLNPADHLHVDRADYELTYHWQQVEIEAGALNQADSVGAHSTVDAADQTITSTVLALRREINRQSVMDGSARIANCDSTSNSTTVNLDPAGYGYDAIVRGWLRPGVAIDIGSAADGDSVAAGRIITGVKEDPNDPEITISGAGVTTAQTDFVSIAGARSRTDGSSLEMMGLRGIVGSDTTTVGGINPTTNSFWKPALVDSTTTTVSLNLLLDLQRAVYQKTGKWPDYVTTSPKQAADLYALYQTQVRFAGDNPSAGNVDGFKWNGMEVHADPDIPDRELYLLTLSDFLVVTGGKFGKPTWASDIEGAGGRLRWKQGATSFVDAVVYPCQLAVKRRNSSAAAVGLTG